MRCGHFPEKIAHAVERKHQFAEYRVFGDLTIVLCTMCWLEFVLEDPTFYGLPRGVKLGPNKMTFVRDANDPAVRKDKCCPSCGRLAFIRFVVAARDLHTGRPH
jgi:hypothetical protein